MFALGAGAAAAAGTAAGGAIAVHKARNEMKSLTSGKDEERANRRSSDVLGKMRDKDRQLDAKHQARLEKRQNMRDDIMHKHRIQPGSKGKEKGPADFSAPLEEKVSGWFSTGFVPRYGSVVGNRLFIYKKATDSEPMERIPLLHAQVILDRQDKEHRTFKVVTREGKEHIFQCEPAALRPWCNALIERLV